MELPNLFKKQRKILALRKTQFTKEQAKEIQQLTGRIVLLVDDPTQDVRLVDQEPQTLGDGNAAFIEPMTDAEYATWRHEEEAGWRKVYNKMLGRDHDTQ